ncbi:MAG: alpha/beta fold hydrolase [Acidobacteria bacterium]|nr:alpha/beta fold hydrolase [Acidobacteriota bacterium]
MPVIGRFRYLERPAAPGVRPRGVLVLIHAFPLDARMWEPQMSLAGHGWRVIAPQLRQFGDDGRQDPPAASVDDYAGDVIDLLDALRIGDAVVGGLSMGGYVSLAICRLAGRYVQGLILADSRAEADTPEGVENRKRLLALVGEKGPQAVVDEMVPKLVGATTAQSRPDVMARVRALARSSSASAISGALTALMTRPDSSPTLARLHVPTLVIVGAEDTLTPPALSEQMRQTVPGAELAIVPAAGHLSNLEQPDGFNAALAHFLEHRV